MSLVATAPRAALSNELNSFLVDFSVALHKHTMYPSAHPSLGPAAVRVTQRAQRLLEDRPMLAFGVARHQLIIDGVATDQNQPVLRRLAEALHMHRLGAVSILPGIDSKEMSGAIRMLAVEVGNGVQPLGDDRTGRLHEWQHVRLHPLTLERLELVEEHDAPAASGEQLDHHAARLWVGLANAALAVDARASQERVVTDPVAVARAIDHNAGAEAYDQVIVGYLLQIADELRAGSAAEDGPLRRRTARLIDALDPETLQRLLAMGGDGTQRRAFVRSAASGMAVDSVVKILRAAAAASQQTISHGLLRMLSKLASHAEVGKAHARPMADAELREQVDRLLEGWTLEDPSPEAYSRTLQHLATSGKANTPDDHENASPHEADPVRVVQISLEVAGTGPIVERAIDQAIDDGAIKELRSLLSTPPEESRTTVDVIRERLSSPRAISSLVVQPAIDFDLLDALLPSISVDAYEVLLDALMSSENRATRRKLIDRLGRTKLDVALVIAEKLEDERWYVQRNLLLLLERLRRVPQGFSTTAWTQHADARVRYQGVSLQLAVPSERETAIRVALADSDPRIIRLGLVAAQTNCPPGLIPQLAELARNAQLAEELRLLAVGILGKSTEEAALNALLPIVNGGKTFLGRPRLASPTPIVLAALRALAHTWSASREAQRFVAQARRSFTSEFRQAVRA